MAKQRSTLIRSIRGLLAWWSPVRPVPPAGGLCGGLWCRCTTTCVCFLLLSTAGGVCLLNTQYWALTWALQTRKLKLRSPDPEMRARGFEASLPRRLLCVVQHAMFEGAVLLRGLLLGALSHSTRAEPDGALKWEGQCGTMLAAAGGRANAASSAAAVQFSIDDWY